MGTAATSASAAKRRASVDAVALAPARVSGVCCTRPVAVDADDDAADADDERSGSSEAVSGGSNRASRSVGRASAGAARCDKLRSQIIDSSTAATASSPSLAFSPPFEALSAFDTVPPPSDEIFPRKIFPREIFPRCVSTAASAARKYRIARSGFPTANASTYGAACSASVAKNAGAAARVCSAIATSHAAASTWCSAKLSVARRLRSAAERAAGSTVAPAGKRAVCSVATAADVQMGEKNRNAKIGIETNIITHF